MKLNSSPDSGHRSHSLQCWNEAQDDVILVRDLTHNPTVHLYYAVMSLSPGTSLSLPEALKHVIEILSISNFALERNQEVFLLKVLGMIHVLSHVEIHSDPRSWYKDF